MKIIFDLDDTLYISPELRQKREDRILDFLGDKKSEYKELRKSLGTIGSFNKLGISKEQFHNLMNEVPIDLERDEELIRILIELKKNHNLIVLSNSSTFCVKTTLEKLGILDIVDKFYSVEDFQNPKPSEECFFMVEKGDICVGNSFRKDLMVPKQKGAKTIFVGGKHPEADFNIKNIHDLEKVILKPKESFSKMKIKIKKLHPDAVIPKYAYPGDAGMDVVAVSKKETENFIEYGTGLAFEIPENHACLVYPRSSISNTGIILANAVGVLDSHYRGELKLRFKKIGQVGQKEYEIGERIAQIIILPFPQIDFVEVEKLSNTERDSGGFGSSGN